MNCIADLLVNGFLDTVLNGADFPLSEILRQEAA